MEVVEPQEEPVPSTREEFNQMYTKQLEAANKDVEDHAHALDSVSYPVSAGVPHPPSQSLHTSSPLLGFVILGRHPPFLRW